MSDAICGANCAECPSKANCKGYAATNGCPFGKQCFIAKYIAVGGMEAYHAFKAALIAEINELSILGMEKVTELYPLVGRFVNLAYPLPSGKPATFLCDDEMYLGAQIPNRLDETCKTCFGVIARESFILICTYGENCTNPQLVLYKQR